MQDPSENSMASQRLHDGVSAQHQVGDSDLTPETSYHPMPEQVQVPPPTPPVQSGRPGGGSRAGAILVMALGSCSS